MNKIIKNTAIVAGILFVATACDSRLDVLPTQTISSAQALSTEQDVNVTLTGAYDGLSNVDVLGGGFQFTAELLGDDREIVFGGTFATLDELWRKTITINNTQVAETWLDSYSAINRANTVLSALDKVSAGTKNSVEGQARFIRAAIYFDLVRLFAKQWGDGDNAANPGVPLVLSPTITVTEANSVKRNSVAEVYAQVIDDLTKAEQLLSANAATANLGVATRNAATALLSRVYLQQNNYASARDAANRVIGTGRHTLAAAFGDAFRDATAGSEVIFKVIVTDQDGSNAMNTYYASAVNQGRGDMRVQTKHTALYEAADVRGKYFNTASGRLYTSKFNDRFGDVPVIRLAELYLTRAECNFRLGTSIGATALGDVNAIRKRAGLANLTQAGLNLAAILKERKLELAFEGNQVHDAKRNKVAVGTLAYNANSLVLPIPQRETDVNKSLVQNPGY